MVKKREFFIEGFLYSIKSSIKSSLKDVFLNILLSYLLFSQWLPVFSSFGFSKDFNFSCLLVDADINFIRQGIVLTVFALLTTIFLILTWRYFILDKEDTDLFIIFSSIFLVLSIVSAIFSTVYFTQYSDRIEFYLTRLKKCYQNPKIPTDNQFSNVEYKMIFFMALKWSAIIFPLYFIKNDWKFYFIFSLSNIAFATIFSIPIYYWYLLGYNKLNSILESFEISNNILAAAILGTIAFPFAFISILFLYDKKGCELCVFGFTSFIFLFAMSCLILFQIP
jgi:hypothetical protein